MVLEFLKAAAFFTQVAAQGLWADVQMCSNLLQIRPVRAVTAEQAADATGQAVATVRAGQQVGGRVLEELLEGAFVL